MKRNLSLTILSVLMLSGCSDPEPKKPVILKKPFVIINKGSTVMIGNYLYQDANGVEKSFSDDQSKYSIGDTIK